MIIYVKLNKIKYIITVMKLNMLRFNYSEVRGSYE